MNRRTTVGDPRFAVAALLALAWGSPCCRPRSAQTAGGNLDRPGAGQERAAPCRASPSPPPTRRPASPAPPSPRATAPSGCPRCPSAPTPSRWSSTASPPSPSRRSRSTSPRQREINVDMSPSTVAGDDHRRRRGAAGPDHARRSAPWSSQKRAREPAAQRPPVRQPGGRSRRAPRSRVQLPTRPSRASSRSPSTAASAATSTSSSTAATTPTTRSAARSRTSTWRASRSSTSRPSSTRPSTAARPAACSPSSPRPAPTSFAGTA